MSDFDDFVKNYPRFEDGTKVGFFDHGLDSYGNDHDVSAIVVTCGGFFNLVDSQGRTWWNNSIATFDGTEVDERKRVKRADLSPVGCDNNHIHKDETVYVKDGDGTPLVVVETPESGCYQSVVVMYPNGKKNSFDPTRITHVKPGEPDSWEKLEKDADLTTCQYFGSGTVHCSTCKCAGPELCSRQKCRDLIRRAKKLSLSKDLTASITEMSDLEQVVKRCMISLDDADWIEKNGGMSGVRESIAYFGYLLHSVVNTIWPDGYPGSEKDKEVVDDIKLELRRRLMPPEYHWINVDGDPLDTTRVYQVDDTPVRILSLCYYGKKLVQEVEVESVDGSDVVRRVQIHRLQIPDTDPIGYDNLPIHRGDTVFNRMGTEFVVESTSFSEVGMPDYVKVRSTNPGSCCEPYHCSLLTHTRPLFGLDNVVIAGGDTVWHKDGRGPWTVEVIHSDTDQVTCRESEKVSGTYPPSVLTHTNPDSWERIEQDAKKLTGTIAQVFGDYDFDDSGTDSVQTRVLDLIRRAKLLSSDTGEKDD